MERGIAALAALREESGLSAYVLLGPPGSACPGDKLRALGAGGAAAELTLRNRGDSGSEAAGEVALEVGEPWEDSLRKLVTAQLEARWTCHYWYERLPGAAAAADEAGGEDDGGSAGGAKGKGAGPAGSVAAGAGAGGAAADA